MAIILGKKRVIDSKTFEDYAIGITLPIQIGNTAFNQSFITAEQVKSNIKNLLLTKRYERLMQPEFGSGIQELLFDMNDEVFAEKLENNIIDTMAKWLSFVTVENIDIQQTNDMKDNNKVEVSISFRISDTQILDTVTFNVQI
jgi:phage baseplate assembly protein W